MSKIRPGCRLTGRSLPSSTYLDDRLLTGACDLCRPVAHNHVDLGPYPKRLCVDTGFNRETGARQETAVVVGFIIVHVDPVSVHFLTQAMPRSMDELVAVPEAGDDVARRAVDLPALNWLPSGHP